MIAKCLACYVTVQLPHNMNRPRLTSQDPGHYKQTTPTKSSATAVKVNPQSGQYVTFIESLKVNKDYATLSEHVGFFLEYVADSAHSLRDANALLVKLASALYPEQGCLVVMRK